MLLQLTSIAFRGFKTTNMQIITTSNVHNNSCCCRNMSL